MGWKGVAKDSPYFRRVKQSREQRFPLLLPDNTQSTMKAIVITAALAALVSLGTAQSLRAPWSGKHWATG